MSSLKISSRTKKRSEDYLIDLNDYNIVRNINRGGFGVINLVRNKKTGKEYASKTNLIQNKSQNKLFVSREVRILIQIQHTTIIQFRGFSYVDFHGDKNITILMDYMKEGSLASLIEKELKSLCPSKYDNTKRQIILVGIARGMMLLHNKHIIHRDLKPENILLDSDFHPRITDFGLSKFFDPHHSMSQSMADSGTAAYMAPEVISSDHFNTKADVYAFGILMYEVIGGKRAYDGLLHGKKKLTLFQLKKKVEEGLRPEIDFPIKKGLRRMIEKCWSEDPKERPTFDELFKKLSLSNEDYFLEFEGNYEEPKIIPEDEDDDEEIEEEQLGVSKRYCLEGVDIGEVLDYVDEIKEETTKTAASRENEELRQQIEIMNQTIKEKTDEVSSLKTDLANVRKEMSALEERLAGRSSDGTSNTKSMEKTIKDQEVKISSLMTELETVKRQKDAQILSLQQRLGRFFSVEMSKEGPGILAQLKDKQKNPFDRLFIASQSSSDIYTLLVPDAKDDFCTSSDGHFFIEFELETEVEISGVKVFSADGRFPKSFDIAVQGETVKSVKEATELNGEYKDMTVSFTPTRGRKVRFTQTGPNWDKNSNFLWIKGIELLSTESKYSKGVFATLVEESENKDPHKCPVIISALHFDLNSFHSLNSKYNTWTYGNENSWFQVELTKGTVVLNGFRLKRYGSGMLKSYKLICTDDPSKPESSWTKLIEINEKTKDEHEKLDIYEFPHPSPPTRFVRLVMTGKDWSDSLNLRFFHFDLFGSYF